MPSKRYVRWLDGSLTAFALLLPLSIALVQPAGYLAAALGLYGCIRYRNSFPGIFPFRLPVVLFMAVLILTAIFGVRPGQSMEKMNRYLLFFAAWAIPFAHVIQRRAPQSAARLMVFFLIGISLKAAFDFIRVPTVVQTMGTPLFHTGNMRDPQFYMVAVCLCAGLLMTGSWRLRYPPTTVALLMAVGGLVIHFKRGAWAACLMALAVMAILNRTWRVLGICAAAVLLLLSLPQTRERLGQLQREFDSGSGGRLTLWTEVAPVLLREYPAGMGWKAVKHEDFIAVSPKVEPGLNHLHNNLLQVALETSVAGLAVWLFLMGAVLWSLYRSYRQAPGGDATAGIALGLFGAFIALLANGMVEYNFGDSEIFMLMMLIMGAASVLAVRGRGSAEDG